MIPKRPTQIISRTDPKTSKYSYKLFFFTYKSRKNATIEAMVKCLYSGAIRIKKAIIWFPANLSIMKPRIDNSINQRDILISLTLQYSFTAYCNKEVENNNCILTTSIVISKEATRDVLINETVKCLIPDSKTGTSAPNRTPEIFETTKTEINNNISRRNNLNGLCFLYSFIVPGTKDEGSNNCMHITSMLATK